MKAKPPTVRPPGGICKEVYQLVGTELPTRAVLLSFEMKDGSTLQVAVPLENAVEMTSMITEVCMHHVLDDVREKARIQSN